VAFADGARRNGEGLGDHAASLRFGHGGAQAAQASPPARAEPYRRP
jgi:hypothetical protein